MSSDDQNNNLPNEEISLLAPRITGLINLVHALDAKLDARLQNTRPIWEAVQTQIAEFRVEVNDQFSKLNKKLDILNRELLEVKTEQELHGDRLDALERKPS